MTVYVLDASAIVELEGVCIDAGHDLEEAFRALTDLVESGELICPARVVRECKDLAPTDRGTQWLRVASANFTDCSAPYTFQEQVIQSCPEIIDPRVTEESLSVIVLSLACYRRAQDHDVEVVTQQWTVPPNQVALASAAVNLGFRAISVETLLGVLLLL